MASLCKYTRTYKNSRILDTCQAQLHILDLCAIDSPLLRTSEVNLEMGKTAPTKAPSTSQPKLVLTELSVSRSTPDIPRHISLAREELASFFCGERYHHRPLARLHPETLIITSETWRLFFQAAWSWYDNKKGSTAVSYTHLTLPTILLV